MTGKKFIDSSTLHRKFLRVKPEIRYLFSKSSKNVKLYFGLQSSYSFRKFDDLDGGSYINAKMDSTYSYDAAKIKSPIFTSTIQFGYEIFSGQLSMDLSQGLGLRVVNTSYTNLINPVQHGYYTPGSPDRIGPIPANWYIGTIVRFQFNINIHFSYYIK